MSINMEGNKFEKKKERWEGIVKIKESFLFKERYLVVDRDCLNFYKRKKGKSKENKTISLRNTTILEPSENQKSTIFTVISSFKKYQIQSEDTSAWINAIQIAIKRAHSNYFIYLPEEMAFLIFINLDFVDLKNITLVCKQFKSWMFDNIFWKNWCSTRGNSNSFVTDQDLEFLGVNWRWIARCKPIVPNEKYNGLGYTKTYFGEIQGGRLHGLVISIYDNAKYVGRCHNGLKDGHGFLLFNKGDRIEGEFKLGKLISGKLTRLNGNQYEGEFKNSKYDGKGILTKKSGKRYEGEFKNGSRNGKGKFTFPDGSKYEGEFKNGKYEGRGIYTNIKGSKYEGEFKNGKYDGFGIYINNFKEYTYEGEFKNGKFHGYGKLINQSKGTRYDGEFKHGWSDGKGSYLSSDGSVYVGDFKRGKYHGFGIYTRNSGAKYEGEFQNGKFDGFGLLYLPHGKFYKGTFKNGKRFSSQQSDEKLFASEIVDSNLIDENDSLCL